MRWVFALALLLAGVGYSAEYKIIKLDRKEIKIPDNVAYLIFDTPKVKEFKVDGAVVVRNGHFTTPTLPDNKIYSYKIEMTDEDGLTETNILSVKRGDIAVVIANDSVLAQTRSGLFKKAIRYEKITPRSDARNDSADILVLNPPGTKVKIDGDTYGDKEIFAVIKLKATLEEVDKVIDIVRDDNTIVDTIKIPIKGGTRTLIGYSDLPVTLTKATKEPPSPTTELFLTPSKDK